MRTEVSTITGPLFSSHPANSPGPTHHPAPPPHPTPNQVAVIDLDFKAASKIPRHAVLDADVLALAAEHTGLLDQVLGLE